MDALPPFEEFSRFLQAQPRVVAAIIFGSSLGKYFRPDSDIDIALLAKDKLDAEETFELKNALENICHRSVDLIAISSDTSAILANEIAREGRLLFTKDEAMSDLFFIKAPQMYEDLMFTRKSLEDAYIARKKND